MKDALIVIQTVISVVLITLILIQARGTGFGRGSSASFTRRGIEKLTFRLTIASVAIFIIVSILRFLV
jgi:protein translocase SecG subunit